MPGTISRVPVQQSSAPGDVDASVRLAAPFRLLRRTGGPEIDMSRSHRLPDRGKTTRRHLDRRMWTNPILRSSRDRSSRPLLRSRRDRFSRPRVSAVRFAGLRRSPHRSLGSRIRCHGRPGDRRLLGPPELTEKWLRLAGHRAQKRGGIRELQSLSDTRFQHHDDFTRDCEGYRQPCGRHTECQ